VCSSTVAVIVDTPAALSCACLVVSLRCRAFAAEKEKRAYCTEYDVKCVAMAALAHRVSPVEVGKAGGCVQEVLHMYTPLCP
jgi:hypothetical protein